MRVYSRWPDLEHAEAAVLNSLNSADAKRGYRHAIDELVDWYCSEPPWPSTGSWSCVIALISNLVNSPSGPINLRLGALRRLGFEAADRGLLSADLAAGIRREGESGKSIGVATLAPHDLGPSLLGSAAHREASWSRSNFSWGTSRCKPLNDTLAASSGFDQR